MTVAGRILRAATMAAVVCLGAVTLTGCTSTASNRPLVLFGSTAAPVADETVAPSRNESSRLTFQLLPMFGSTCRPDRRVDAEVIELAMAQGSSRPTFDLLPMFGSTCSPASFSDVAFFGPSTLPSFAAPPATPADRTSATEPSGR